MTGQYDDLFRRLEIESAVSAELAQIMIDVENLHERWKEMHAKMKLALSGGK